MRNGKWGCEERQSSNFEIGALSLLASTYWLLGFSIDETNGGVTG
jgi:hypothetical protein